MIDKYSTDKYNRDGTLFTGSIAEWGEMFNNCDRQIAETSCHGTRISTVFLSLDHNYTFEGPPLIFETMIFGPVFDSSCWRYSTEEDALEGHEFAVLLVKNHQAINKLSTWVTVRIGDE